MRAAAVAAVALALSACASAPRPIGPANEEFDFARYVPTALAEAERPADGMCAAESRPAFALDMALTPMRLKASATQRFRDLPADAVNVIGEHDQAATADRLRALGQEVLVHIEGQPRWLPIQAAVAPFWRRELDAGQDVWLYTTRFGCLQPVDPGADRAILSINEFQVEPFGPPEPAQ